MNEYFVKFEVSHYQELPTTEFYFIMAESGEKAYSIGLDKVRNHWDSPFFEGSAKELTGIELLDIRRL